MYLVFFRPFVLLLTFLRYLQSFLFPGFLHRLRIVLFLHRLLPLGPCLLTYYHRYDRVHLCPDPIFGSFSGCAGAACE